MKQISFEARNAIESEHLAGEGKYRAQPFARGYLRDVKEKELPGFDMIVRRGLQLETKFRSEQTWGSGSREGNPMDEQKDWTCSKTWTRQEVDLA